VLPIIDQGSLWDSLGDDRYRELERYRITLFQEAPMADKPKYRQTDIAAQVRRVDPKPGFYPVYEFTGRTFVKRDRPGKRPE
jgi:hypothetical protein